MKVPDSFLEEMGRWKIPSTSIQGSKTHELKAVASKVAASSGDPDKTQPSRQKIAARAALKPSPKALAVKARAPDDDDDWGEETLPQPLDEEDGIETAETMRFRPQKSNVRGDLEPRPSQTDNTQPSPPAIFEARRKKRFWSHLLKALTLIAVAAIVIAIVMMRQESARDLAEEASRLIEQRRYPEASEVLARCLQLEPASSECRQLQQKASSPAP